MQRLGQAATADEREAEVAISAIEDWRGSDIRYAPMAAGLASPSHRGVDSVRWAVSLDGAPPAFLLKVTTAEQAPLVDLEVAFRAAEAAAALGATPRPLHLLIEHRAAVFDLLPPDWRTARMDDLRKPDVLGKVIARKAAIHKAAPFTSAWTVFDRLRTMDDQRKVAGVNGPPDLWWLLDWAARIEQAVAAAGFDTRPGHGDGLASNVMIAPDGAVLLVDFDEARNDDPYCELGALLNETFQFESEMEAGLEMFEGSVRRASLNRCRAYAAADDLVWGIWALTMNSISPRSAYEFLKYAQWRLLRCRMALRDPGFEEKLRRL